MGFRYRKSFGSGPFRVNLSKSGIGYSVGTKGFRYTKKANGGTRTTASIPGTGISYVKESGKEKRGNGMRKSGGKFAATKNTSNKRSTKKPFYKRWWFWLIVISILLNSCNGSDQKDVPVETMVPETTTPATESLSTFSTEPIVIESTEPTTPATTPTTETTQPITEATEYTYTYILNTSTMKFHYSSCSSAEDIKDSNRSTFTGARDELLARNYEPCGRCHP